MSIAATTWAYAQDPGDTGAKFVLVALADYADEAWSCYPSQARLAAMTGQSDRTVRRHLKVLESAGLITREKRHGKSGARTSDRYVLAVNAPPTGQNDQWSDCPPVSVTTGQDDQAPRTPVSRAPRTRVSTEPSFDPSMNRQVAREAEPDRFDEFWAAYPRKDDKGRARKAWVAALKKAPAERIIEGARRYAATPGLLRDGARFVKLPTSWLNAEAWDNQGVVQPVERTPYSIWDHRPGVTA